MAEADYYRDTETMVECLVDVDRSLYHETWPAVEHLRTAGH